jgi:hypothetical protein
MYRHFGIQWRGLRQISRTPLGFEWLFKYVESCNPSSPVSRWEISSQNTHRRGLARAVRTEETEDLPPFDAEADVIDRRKRPVALGYVLHFDHDAIS